MLDRSPHQASYNEFMVLTITEETLKYFEIPSNLCFTFNSDSSFIIFWDSGSSNNTKKQTF